MRCAPQRPPSSLAAVAPARAAVASRLCCDADGTAALLSVRRAAAAPCMGVALHAQQFPSMQSLHGTHSACQGLANTLLYLFLGVYR